ncbi:hypothetical protein [Glutamicibacter arilaitensis]|uniref:Uncharacterized protein n=1 Tax=Glutamicibacter arilaitensis TaxID=256701 RepID=A0A2N7S6Y3_9MICC|nr:hypothetical protein [Glutamicibacter arilaitensis]PMQ21901.1 hypothetical protein CIK84_10415 [Glutamicibacter arilaitensis]
MQIEMTEFYYRTKPVSAPAPPKPGKQCQRRMGWIIPAVLAFTPGGPGTAGALTLGIFAIAIWAWTSTKIPDSNVAVCACLALVAVGAFDTQQPCHGRRQDPKASMGST